MDEYYGIVSDTHINEHSSQIAKLETEMRRIQSKLKINGENAKYKQYFYDLSELEVFAARCLGFDIYTWGDKDKFRDENNPLCRKWKTLTQTEKSAAIILGFEEDDFFLHSDNLEDEYKSNIKKLEEKINNLEKQVNNIDVNNLCLQKTYENKVIRLEKKIEELKNENKKHNDITEKGIKTLKEDIEMKLDCDYMHKEEYNLGIPSKWKESSIVGIVEEGWSHPLSYNEILEQEGNDVDDKSITGKNSWSMIWGLTKIDKQIELLEIKFETFRLELIHKKKHHYYKLE
jgi:hypothetical protein